MLYLEKIADWVHGQSEIAFQIADRMYQDHPNLFVLTLTTAAKASWVITDVAADTLRIGEGSKQGGFGYVEDALRILSVFPVSKTIPLAQRLAAASFEHNVGPLCTWVSITKALRLTGKNLYITVDELMNAVGKALGAKGPCTMLRTNIAGCEEVLRFFGARTTRVFPKDLKEIELVLRARRGVITFFVEWTVPRMSKMGTPVSYVNAGLVPAHVTKSGEKWYVLARRNPELWQVLGQDLSGYLQFMVPVTEEKSVHAMVAFLDKGNRLRIADCLEPFAADLASLDWLHPGIAEATMCKLTAGDLQYSLFIDEAEVILLEAQRLAAIAFAARIALQGSEGQIRSLVKQLWSPSVGHYLFPLGQDHVDKGGGLNR